MAPTTLSHCDLSDGHCDGTQAAHSYSEPVVQCGSPRSLATCGSRGKGKGCVPCSNDRWRKGNPFGGRPRATSHRKGSESCRRRGKSFPSKWYLQLAAAEGRVVVVCPLKSLMADHIANCPWGIEAGCMYSGNSMNQHVLRSFAAAHLSLLMVSPELFVQPWLHDALCRESGSHNHGYTVVTLGLDVHRVSVCASVSYSIDVLRLVSCRR